MKINATHPSFQGLIVMPDGKKAVNTEYITEMEESTDYKGAVSTTIWAIDGTKDTFDVPLQDILSAYKKAAKDKAEIVYINSSKA